MRVLPAVARPPPPISATSHFHQHHFPPAAPATATTTTVAISVSWIKGNAARRVASSAASVSSVPSATRTDVGRSTSRQAAVARVKESQDPGAALSSLSGVLQVQDLNLILRHFGDLERWSEVSQVFDWMQKHDKVNIASYSSFIKYLGKSQNPAKALQIYSRIGDIVNRTNVSVCNSLLGCMLKNGKFESGMKLYDQMKEDGLKPDLVTYSTLLAGCSKVKNGYPRAMQLVHELESNSLRMDSVIYGTLLAICASNNLCEEAELFFQQMRSEGLSPNLFHYSSLLNAYSADGDYVKADLLVKDLKSEGLVPNKVILTTLLKVYVRGGLLEKSRELLSELEALGYAEEEMPYCLLMDNLAKAGHIHEAKAIFDLMESRSVKSDGYCYSIMISAFCRSGLLKEAKQLAEDFEARYDKYDLVMINTLLRAYCNNGEMENVMQMLKKMDELAISPDWNTFQILIKYFRREKLHHLAYRTIEDMHSKGYQLDEELCSSLIIQLAQTGAPSEAFSVYNMLRYSKRVVCKSLHEKMLNILVGARLLKDAYVVMKDNATHISGSTLKKFALSFMKSGNINMINDVLKAFHRAGRRLDQEVFRIAVSRYIAKPEKKDLLLQMLQWMSGHGYVVDSSTRNLLLKNSQLLGQKHLIAEALSKQHAMLRKLKVQEEK